jgi:ribose transport system ATP-binding protein
MQTLTFAGLSKSYGGAPALSDVTLTLHAGRMHALMGENGAGKSTLIKLIAGVVRADRMQALKDGVPLTLRNPGDATRAGFRFIHQELNIVPQLSVAENVLLGRAVPHRFGAFIDWRRMRAQARAALERLDAGHIDVTVQAGDLTTGDRMLTRIASALVAEEAGAEPCLYVLDEPTAALTARESERLFAALERLKAGGAAVLYVSHRLAEVMQICDDVTVLRDGRQVMTAKVGDTGREALIRAMTGKAVAETVPLRTTAAGTTPVLTVRGAAGPAVGALNFSLCDGEILGLAGLQDAGQSEVLRLILGADPLRAGQVTFLNQRGPQSPTEAWARGMAYVPRERRAEGLMLAMAVRPNMLVSHLADYGFRARKGAEVVRTRDLAGQVQLRAQGTEQPVGQLSGGNQQKVVFARALAGKPRLLLLEEPTRGVDVGARAEIHALIRAASAAGCAVIVASTDLPELLGLSDRLLYLAHGRQVALEDKAPGMTPADILDRVYVLQGVAA